MTLKSELTGKVYSLNSRLKLFNSVVSASMLYGCAAWTLTTDLESQVRRTQRRMLRMILGSGRRTTVDQNGSKELETWVDWLKRTTHEVEDRLASLNMDDWVTSHRRTKLEWARKLVTTDVNTWAFRALAWQPDPWKYQRPQARPRRRWLGDITEILDRIGVTMPWQAALGNDEVWSSVLNDLQR